MSEPTEERVRNLWTLVMGQSINDGCDAIRQALAQEAQRANELKEVDDVCYQQLRAKYVAADDRAEGLAKELEALRAQSGRIFRDAAAWAGATPCPPWNSEDERSHYDTMADLCAAEIAERARAIGLPIEGFTWAAAHRKVAASDWEDTIAERDEATARGAELEKQLAAMQSRAEAGEADWQTAEAELAKLREQVGAQPAAGDESDLSEEELARYEKAILSEDLMRLLSEVRRRRGDALTKAVQ